MANGIRLQLQIIKIRGLANLRSTRVEQIWWHWTAERPHTESRTHLRNDDGISTYSSTQIQTNRTVKSLSNVLRCVWTGSVHTTGHVQTRHGQEQTQQNTGTEFVSRLWQCRRRSIILPWKYCKRTVSVLWADIERTVSVPRAECELPRSEK